MSAAYGYGGRRDPSHQATGTMSVASGYAISRAPKALPSNRSRPENAPNTSAATSASLSATSIASAGLIRSGRPSRGRCRRSTRRRRVGSRAPWRSARPPPAAPAAARIGRARDLDDQRLELAEPAAPVLRVRRTGSLETQQKISQPPERPSREDPRAELAATSPRLQRAIEVVQVVVVELGELLARQLSGGLDRRGELTGLVEQNAGVSERRQLPRRHSADPFQRRRDQLEPAVPRLRRLPVMQDDDDVPVGLGVGRTHRLRSLQQHSGDVGIALGGLDDRSDELVHDAGTTL